MFTKFMHKQNSNIYLNLLSFDSKNLELDLKMELYQNQQLLGVPYTVAYHFRYR